MLGTSPTKGSPRKQVTSKRKSSRTKSDRGVKKKEVRKRGDGLTLSSEAGRTLGRVSPSARRALGRVSRGAGRVRRATGILGLANRTSGMVKSLGFGRPNIGLGTKVVALSQKVRRGVDTLERGRELIENSVKTLTTPELDAARGPLADDQALARKKTSKTPREFQMGIQEKGLSLKKLPQLNQLLQNLPSGYLTKQGYHHVLGLMDRHGEQKSEQFARILSSYLAKNKNDKKALSVVQSGLKDIADPTSIAQGEKGNCGAIMTQQIWAKEKPVDYLSALTTLAEGKPFQFANGNRLHPLNAALAGKSDERSNSVKILSDALARHAHTQSVVRQTAIALKNPILSRSKPIKGLDNYHPTKQNSGAHLPPEIALLLKDVTGHDYRVQITKSWPVVSKSLDRGDFVPTLLAGGRGASLHWVNTTKYDKGRSHVVFASWGDQFQSSLKTAKPHVKLFLVRDN